MEEINAIWEQIMPYLTNATVITVVTALGTAFLKSFVNKKFNANEMNKLFKTSFDNSVNHIKEMTFKQDITPLVDSRLQLIEEKANAKVEKELAITKAILKEQTEFMKTFISYFDSSMLATDDKKEELEKAFNKVIALCEKSEPAPVECTVAVEEPKKEDGVKQIEIER